jgi:hypothetical protein
MREFFNTLSGDSQLGVTPQAIAAILVGLAVARSMVILADMYAHNLYTFRTGALLRKNLLIRILERPGARAVPQSPGEAISRSAMMSPYPEFTSQVPLSSVRAVCDYRGMTMPDQRAVTLSPTCRLCSWCCLATGR